MQCLLEHCCSIRNLFLFICQCQWCTNVLIEFNSKKKQIDHWDGSRQEVKSDCIEILIHWEPFCQEWEEIHLISKSLFNDIFVVFSFCFLQKDCPSGKLNKKKFIEVYKQFYPTGKAEKFCEYVFRTFDTDGSGNIGKNLWWFQSRFNENWLETFLSFSVSSQDKMKFREHKLTWIKTSSECSLRVWSSIG